MDLVLSTSPPVHKLNVDSTFAQENLVPAALVHLSWISTPVERPGCYFSPHLTMGSDARDGTRAMYPKSVAVQEQTESKAEAKPRGKKPSWLKL